MNSKHVVSQFSVLSHIFQLRFGMVSKQISNTSIFEHSGKFYASAENHLPREIDIFTLETFDKWDVNGAWDRAFTSHPKVLPLYN